MEDTEKLDFIVKLGGCAITDKNEFESLKLDKIMSAAVMLARCYAAGKRFIVIHGAGSYGHHQAKEYGLHNGYRYRKGSDDKDSKRIRHGFCVTKISVSKTFASWNRDGEGRMNGETISVSRVMALGFVPVMHGDLIADVKLGCSVLSGDVVCEVLCAALKPKYVVFLEDVAGVYDKPPLSNDAALIRELRVDARGQLSEAVSTSVSEFDVTGGIDQKLSSAVNIVLAREVPVIVCEIDSPASEHVCFNGRLSAGLRGTTILMG